MLLELAHTPDYTTYFGTAKPIEPAVVQNALNRVSRWNQQLTSRALDRLGAIPGLTIYGPREAARRTSLVAFNIAGRDPVSLAEGLNRAGVEARAGCHCATLAHHALGLSPPASCRLSFYLYNTLDEVDRTVDAVAAIADHLAARALIVLPAGQITSLHGLIDAIQAVLTSDGGSIAADGTVTLTGWDSCSAGHARSSSSGSWWPAAPRGSWAPDERRQQHAWTARGPACWAGSPRAAGCR